MHMSQEPRNPDSVRTKATPSPSSIYHAVMDRDTPEEHRASSERHFCSKCGSMLWVYDKQWPELIHPFAAAIDSELAVVEEMVRLLVFF